MDSRLDIHSRYILVADAEPTLAELLVAILTDEGYVAVGVSRPADLIRCVTQLPPALVLLDAQLGDIGSTTIIEWFRHPECLDLVHIPIIVWTLDQRGMTTSRERVMYLDKPFDLNELLRLVHAWMAQPKAVT